MDRGLRRSRTKRVNVHGLVLIIDSLVQTLFVHRLLKMRRPSVRRITHRDKKLRDQMLMLEMDLTTTCARSRGKTCALTLLVRGQSNVSLQHGPDSSLQRQKPSANYRLCRVERYQRFACHVAERDGAIV